MSKLPEGPLWTWEIKLDGWRMEVVKTGGRVTLYSRRGKNFTAQFGTIARELAYLPDETVLDGEVVAVDEQGRPSFNLLQNFRSGSRIVYYAFDIPIHNGNDLMRRPLSQRREVLRSVVRTEGHVGISEASDRPLAEMVKFIQTHGLEGIVAKRADSSYQSGLRTVKSARILLRGHAPPCAHLARHRRKLSNLGDQSLWKSGRAHPPRCASCPSVLSLESMPFQISPGFHSQITGRAFTPAAVRDTHSPCCLAKFCHSETISGAGVVMKSLIRVLSVVPAHHAEPLFQTPPCWCGTFRRLRQASPDLSLQEFHMRYSVSLAGFFGIALLTFVSQAAAQQTEPEPTITPTPGGYYTPPLTITISDADRQATVYYKTSPDTLQTPRWLKYSGPFILPYSAEVLAIAEKEGSISSNVAGASYSVNEPLQFIPVTPCRIADTRNATGPFGGPELAARTTRKFDIPQSSCGIPAKAFAYSLNVTVVPNSSLGSLIMWPSQLSTPWVVSTLNSYDGRVKANAQIVAAGLDGGVSVYASDATNVILDINGYFVLAGSSSSALAFYPLTPCRIADTRNPRGQLGGPFITGHTSRAFPILSSSCNVPSTAKAYSLNVTAVPHKTLHYLSIWPTGQTQPLASTLNSYTGTVTANAATVKAGIGGDVSVFVTDDSDVILDINGYFAPPRTGGLSLYLVVPCKVLDTRNAAGAFNGALSVNVYGVACVSSAAAQGYVLNATVMPKVPLGYLTLWPEGEKQPYVSTLNSEDGTITSNMAIVTTTNGSIDAYATDLTDLILDISGYFAP